MAVGSRYLFFITITTTLTTFISGELFLQMPLTINPVVQEIIETRSPLLTRFHTLDPQYYSHLTAAHMAVKLNNSLQFVMQKTVKGAIVLGAAAKMAGLTVQQLYNTNAYSRWSVNVTLSEIRSIMSDKERELLPFSDEIKIATLQSLGLRVLQKRYNISLPRQIVDPLHLSATTKLSVMTADWIRLVRYITKFKVVQLASRYGVAVFTLAEALQYTTDELYRITLNELDQVLTTNFTFDDGTLQVLSTTMMTLSSTTRVPLSTSVPPEITTNTVVPSSRQTDAVLETESTAPTVVLQSTPVVPNANEGSSTGEKKDEDINKILIIGVAVVAVLLFLVIITCTWYLKTRKRRNNGENKVSVDNDIKLNNFWIDKNGDEPSPDELVINTRRQSNTGDATRAKGVTYVPTHSTFERQTNVRTSIYDYDIDTRKEIFV